MHTGRKEEVDSSDQPYNKTSALSLFFLARTVCRLFLSFMGSTVPYHYTPAWLTPMKSFYRDKDGQLCNSESANFAAVPTDVPQTKHEPVKWKSIVNVSTLVFKTTLNKHQSHVISHLFP